MNIQLNKHIHLSVPKAQKLSMKFSDEPSSLPGMKYKTTKQMSVKNVPNKPSKPTTTLGGYDKLANK